MQKKERLYQWKQRRKQVEKAEQANYRLWEVQD